MKPKVMKQIDLKFEQLKKGDIVESADTIHYYVITGVERTNCCNKLLKAYRTNRLTDESCETTDFIESFDGVGKTTRKVWRLMDKKWKRIWKNKVVNLNYV